MTADESGPDGGPPNHPGAISEEELAALPEVVIHKRRMPSTIWLVPIVAALVGGWLWYDAIQSQGPLITIRFPTAEGLQEGKTAIKRLAVEVGKVTTIELGEDGHSVVISDSGPGIPASERKNVFRRFYRVESSRGEQPGHGLGLSLVQAIAQYHRGSVELGSNNPGLQVRIRLP